MLIIVVWPFIDHLTERHSPTRACCRECVDELKGLQEHV